MNVYHKKNIYRCSTITANLSKHDTIRLDKIKHARKLTNNLPDSQCSTETDQSQRKKTISMSNTQVPRTAKAIRWISSSS